jgi:hypothetical protein
MSKHNVEIKYSRPDKEYSVTVDENLIGYARNYSEGEMLANAYITEQAAQAARALPQPVQDFLDTLDDAPALPAVFTATSAEPLDAMLQALERAASLIARLGDDVISQTDEVTVSVCGQPLTTVVVVVAPRVAVGAYAKEAA